MGTPSWFAIWAFLFAGSLGGCCIDISGTNIHSSTGSSTGSNSNNDSGPRSTLWIGGIGAIDTSGLPVSGTVPFAETCIYPYSAPVFGDLGGVAAIDGAGALWAQQQINPYGTLFMWTPDQLSQSCESGMPTKALNLQPFLTSVAFDPEGNLWGATPFTDGYGLVVGYRSTDLETSGSPPPAWTLSGNCNSLDSLCHPVGLAFDADGYLWVSGSLGLQAYSPSTRTGPNDGGLGGTGPLADFHITTSCDAAEIDGGIQGLDCVKIQPPFGDLAFDAAGNLWLSIGYPVAYSRAQLQNAMNDDQPMPVVFAVSETGAAGEQAPAFLAFDADGNLWMGAPAFGSADAGTSVLRLPREAVGVASGPPNRVTVVPDLLVTVRGDAVLSLAFSPIPPGLPIQP